MKATTTKVKNPGGVRTVTTDAHHVLIISRSWKTVYQWLQEDVAPVLFTTKEIRQGFDYADAHSYAHIEAFEDIDAAIVDFRAEVLHQEYHFTQVLALGEEDLLRCARIRKRLGLENTGQTIESALRYRDKVIMKEVLLEAGIRVPVFSAVESAQDIIEFYEKHGPKVVIKPKSGYGSVKTTIISNKEELIAFLTDVKWQLDAPQGMEIEKFVEGPMFHVDGFVSSGVVTYCHPSLYLNMCIDFTKANYNASHSLSMQNPLLPRIQGYVCSVLKALGGPSDFPFHAEVWHTSDDELILCEIASRVGGAGIRHAFRSLFGVLLDEIWVARQTSSRLPEGVDLSINFSERSTQVPTTGWIILFPEEGKLLSLPEKEAASELKFILHYFPIGTPGHTYKKASHSADSVAMFVVSGNDEADVRDNLFKARDWFTGLAQWEHLPSI